jgi:transposase
MSFKCKFVTLKKVTLDLFTYFCAEAKRGRLFCGIHKPKERVRHALGLSKSTLHRWLVASSNLNGSKPHLKRGRREKVDNFDRNVIKRELLNIIEKKEYVTLRKLKVWLSENNNIDISKQTLWKIVRQIGFTFQKGKSGKNVLCEKPHLLHLRNKYLREIREKRKLDYDIVYLDETWVNAHHTKDKEWQLRDGCCKRQIPSSKGQRIVVAHAGSANVGFIPNAELVFLAKSTDNRDYHHEMNSNIFKSWLRDTLLPALDTPSCIVMDNASYHNFVSDTDKIPTSSSTKQHIREWLTREKLDFDPMSLKAELLDRVHKSNKSKIFEIDKLIAEHGHTCLRLPPYHSHLNPIELIWAKVKGDVADRNTTFKISDINHLTHVALSEITVEYWKKCIDHVIREEEDYWQRDGLGFLQPNIVINLLESTNSE